MTYWRFLPVSALALGVAGGLLDELESLTPPGFAAGATFGVLGLVGFGALMLPRSRKLLPG
jgi:hypothetical protein